MHYLVVFQLENEIKNFSGKEMELENVMLSEVTPPENDKP